MNLPRITVDLKKVDKSSITGFFSTCMQQIRPAKPPQVFVTEFSDICAASLTAGGSVEERVQTAIDWLKVRVTVQE